MHSTGIIILYFALFLLRHNMVSVYSELRFHAFFFVLLNSLITLVVQLIKKIDFTTLEVLEFLLGIAAPGNDDKL